MTRLEHTAELYLAWQLSASTRCRRSHLTMVGGDRMGESAAAAVIIWRSSPGLNRLALTVRSRMRLLVAPEDRCRHGWLCLP